MTRVKVIDRPCPSPQEDLDLDNRLLAECEHGERGPTLRFWEPTVHTVVLGHSGSPDKEVNASDCARFGVPILRRSSGGGTVLIGPGCLNYSLVLPIPESGPLRSIRDTTRHVLTRHRDALSSLLGSPVEIQGTSDLTLHNRKFSGNAQRRKRHALLFHGTFLHAMDLSLMDRLLPLPPRRPAYRADRAHASFLTNLPASLERIKSALAEAWSSA